MKLQNILDGTLIQSQTANASSSLIFNNIPSGWSTLFLMFASVQVGTASSIPLIQFSSNNGSSFVSTNYQSGSILAPYNSTPIAPSSTTSGCLLCDSIASTSGSASGYIYIQDFNSSNFPATNGASALDSGTTVYVCLSVGRLQSGGANSNSFQVLASAGNISGNFYLYGIVN